MAIEILHYDDLPIAGCAGLKEHRLVMSPKLFGQFVNPGTWTGIGNFVYLAEAGLDPKGETTLHDHKEIDIIYLMIEGRIVHQGSLQQGQELEAGMAQVLRAGGEGFSHNEINPEDSSNRLIQLWILPEHSGELAAYRLYTLDTAKVTRIYGGSHSQTDTLISNTVIDIAQLESAQEFFLDKPFLAYLAVGSGLIDNQEIKDGTLFKGNNLNFKANSVVTLIVIHEI